MKNQLYQCRTKQPFRVAKGKSKWFWFEFPYNYTNYIVFKPKLEEINLREILDDEVVIEFDTDNKSLAWEGINFTAMALYKAGITFEIWDHDGKSPHLHIRNLPISHLSKDERRLWKKVFIRTYVPKEYLEWVDISLTGVHLIALEWQEHWKGRYGIKKLLSKF